MYECTPSFKIRHILEIIKSNVHIPYLPSIKNPAWLVRYVVGPYNKEYFDLLKGDIIAGITLGIVLVPQALAYSILAGLPAINGLYASIPSLLAYMFLGSSMQLNVGPATLISLLTSQIIAKHIKGDSDIIEQTMDIAAQASLQCGIILACMGLLNMGYLMNLVSGSVLRGFTTGAALCAGLSQLPGAVGMQSGKFFSQVPKLGQIGYEYNYQVMAWFVRIWFKPLDSKEIYQYQNDNQKDKFDYMVGWNRFNPYAVKLFCGVYIPLIILQVFKDNLKITDQLKNTLWYRIFIVIHPMMSIVAICIAGRVTMELMQAPNLTDVSYNEFMQHNINIVADVPSGVSFIRVPEIRCDIGNMFFDVLPITFIILMESIAIGKIVATQRNQLNFLNSSQDLFAVGISNILASVSSGFPVAGGFTRTSLSALLGGSTPLTSGICLLVILVAIGAVADKFYYIPQAGLSALVFIAAYGLINISDFWIAWKLKKKDFNVMIVTCTATFLLNSPIGLLIGIVLSFLTATYDIVNSEGSKAKIITSDQDVGVEVVKVYSDHITFLTSESIKTIVHDIVQSREIESNSLKGIVLDISSVSMIDLTGARALLEITKEVRITGLLFVTMILHPSVCETLIGIGLECDGSTSELNLDKYLQNSRLDTVDLTRNNSSTTSCSDTQYRSDSKVYIDDSNEDKSLAC